MSAAELAEAKRYGRLGLFCSVADKIVNVAYLAVAAFLLAQPFDRWLRGLSPLLDRNWSLRLLALLLLITGLHILVSFPLSFYSGHILEHQFHLSAQSFGGWLWRYVKRNLLAIAFTAVMLLGLYWLIWTPAAGGGRRRRRPFSSWRSS